MSDPVADLYVAPDGDDANDGSLERPLRSVEAARSLLRPKLDEMDSDLVVMIREGTWYLERTLTFGPQDSGQNGFRVIYRDYPGESPKFVGGREVVGWEHHSGDVWKAPVEAGSSSEQLFADDVRQTKARHPNEGYHIVESADQGSPKQAFSYRPGDIPESFTFGPEAQAFIWSGQDWFSDTVPIDSVDRETRTVRLREETLCPIVRGDGYVSTRRYFIQGVREALDSPGEFSLDEEEGVLYFWPPSVSQAGRPEGSPEELAVVAPTINRVIELRGDSPQAPVQNIQIEGLTVSVSKFGRHFTETRGTHGKTIWNEPANRDAAIYLEHADHCSVRSCEIRNAGYNGITLNGRAQHNEVYGNRIEQAGFHGVLLIGYAPRTGTTLDVNKRNEIVNNHIHHCGRLVGHGAGVFVHSSGHNRVAHNLIHHMPRYGICSKGEHAPPEGQTFEEWLDANHSRHNVYEYNHVHHCNLDTEDSGMISFISTGPHNIVRHNLIHDNPRDLHGLAFGIYLDDGASHFTVNHNVIYGLNGGGDGRVMAIYAKGIHNRITNNVLVCGPKAAAAITCAEMFGMLCHSHEWERNIVVLKGADTRVWSFWNWNENRLSACDSNLFCVPSGECSFEVPAKDGRERLALNQWREFEGAGFDQHSLVADPGFVDSANHDYRLRPDSPAHSLGIESIDTSGCGLLPSFPFGD